MHRASDTAAAFYQALGPEKVWQRDGRGWTWQLSELEKEFASDSFYCWRQSSVDGNLTWSNLVVNNSIFEPRFFFGEMIHHSVDGNPANQLRLVGYPIIYRVFIHPRWLGMGFLLQLTRPKVNSGSQRLI